VDARRKYTPLLALAVTACAFEEALVGDGPPGSPQSTPAWTLNELDSTAEASLRGLAVVDELVAWCGGSDGTLLRTTDGGRHWLPRPIPGAEDLDFRSLWALDAQSAWTASAGPGSASRIYHTSDGGQNWTLQHTNREPEGFFDAIAFWPGSAGQRGLVVGDPVAGHLTILRTEDGGAHWEPLPSAAQPPSLPGEYAFAASGTSLALVAPSTAWIVTGGSVARMLRSTDGGTSWVAVPLPLGDGSEGAGAFSIATGDGVHGVVVGGNYREPELAARHWARTEDGGRSWSGPGGSGGAEGPEGPTGPAGYRSCVAVLPRTNHRTWIAVGPSGVDISDDGGRVWRSLGHQALNSVAWAPSGRRGFAVGPAGSLYRLEPVD
jgi:hypothetical protein